jgi:hypothetical protein
MPPVSRSAAPRRRRKLLAVLAASLPMFLLAGLLVAPGMASAGIPYGPDLVVSIQDNPDPVTSGGTVTFTVLVANVGNEDSYSTTVNFNTDGDDIVSATSSSEGECSSEGTSVTCDLGYIPGSNVSGGGEAPVPLLAFNEAEAVIEVTAPSEDGQFDSSAIGASFDEGPQSDTNPSDNEDSETTTVESEGGDSDSGTIDPGETLSTVPGTNANPVTTADPFAVSLENVSDGSLDGSVAEEACDGSQESDPLCSQPRVGGVLGNYQFVQSAPALRLPTVAGSLQPPVAIARLFYDKTVVQGVKGFRIFYQKNPGGPVLRLQRCQAGELITECFKTNKKKSGDQIVRVPLSSDPRVTRG